MAIRAHAMGYLNPRPWLPGDHKPDQGPKCSECAQTEARCANVGCHCCDGCTHLFGDETMERLADFADLLARAQARCQSAA